MINQYNMDYVFGREHRKVYMGLAMLWIIGYHFYLVQSEFIDAHLFPFKLLLRNGFIGVDVFFILSAYGLCCSWERSSVWEFYKKRFLRIIPLYIVFLLLCKVILRANHVLSDGLLQMSSLSVLNTPLTRTKGMGGEWFVPAIINLYIIFPLLFMAIRWMKNHFPKYGLYIVVTMAILISGGAISYVSPNYIMRLPIIVAGIIAYLCVKQNDEKLLLGVFVYMAMFYLVIERKNIMLSVVLPLILFGLNELKFTINQKWIHFVGGISFELYLSHIIPMNFARQNNVLLSLEIMICGTVVLCLLYHGINRFILTKKYGVKKR